MSITSNDEPSYETIKQCWKDYSPESDELKPPRTHPIIDICEPPRWNLFHPYVMLDLQMI